MTAVLLGSLSFAQESAVQGDLRQRLVDEARGYLGTPYVYAGASQDGVDCSGLVYAVYHTAAEVSLPRRVEDLIIKGNSVIGSPSPGDLVFFDTDEPMIGSASHVGIMIGDRDFIHAASAGRRTGVIISSLEEDYYSRRYLGIRRYVQAAPGYLTVDLGGRSVDPRPFARESPVRFILLNSDRIEGFVAVAVYRNNELLFSKRMRMPSDGGGLAVWFIPEPGTHTVVLKDQREVDLNRISFIVR